MWTLWNRCVCFQMLSCPQHRGISAPFSHARMHLDIDSKLLSAFSLVSLQTILLESTIFLMPQTPNYHWFQEIRIRLASWVFYYADPIEQNCYVLLHSSENQLPTTETHPKNALSAHDLGTNGVGSFRIKYQFVFKYSSVMLQPIVNIILDRLTAYRKLHICRV